MSSDYLEALESYPIEAIRSGIRHGLKKWKFRPTIAEIVAEATRYLPAPTVYEPPVAERPVPVLTDEERARRKAAAAALPEGPFKQFALIACNPRTKGGGDAA